MKKSMGFVLIPLICLMIQSGSPGRLSAADEISILQKYKNLIPTIDKAKKHFLAKNFAKAEKEMIHCCKTLPEHYEANYFLAQIRYQNGNFPLALSHIETAIAEFNHFRELLRAVEQKKSKLRQTEELQQMEMMNQYNILIDLNKSSPDSISNLARRAKNSVGPVGSSAQLDSEQMQLKVPADYHYWHGNCLFRLQRFTEAEKSYREAIATDPEHAAAYNNLLNLLFGQQKIALAAELLKEADAKSIAINPELKRAVLDAN